MSSHADRFHEPPPPLRSQFSDDPDMLEIIEMFVREMPERVAELTALWERRELEGFKRSMHQLKGASGGYGYPAIGSAAARLEADLAAIADGNTAAPMQNLREQFNALLDLCRRVSAR